MTALKKENGIALVTVLLMITVFSILGLAVISLTISNTKQVTKTEQEMQAVDLAEMGVVYYKNAFITNTNEKLRSAIEAAIEAINQHNKANPKNMIDINPLNILAYLNIQKNDYLPQVYVSQSIPVDENSIYSFEIKDHFAQEDDYSLKKIKIVFESIGKVQQNQEVEDNKSVTGTIKLDINEELIANYLGNGTALIKKPEGLNENCPNNGILQDGCSYNTKLFNSSNSKINSITALINGSLQLSDKKKQIGKNSLLYITEDANFGELNGNLDTSKLYIGGKATFGNIRGGIKNHSILFIGGDAEFGTVNGGGVDKTSLVCAGGNITGGLSDNGVNIISKIKSPQAYENKCLRGRESNDLSQPIAESMDLSLKYQ